MRRRGRRRRALNAPLRDLAPTRAGVQTPASPACGSTSHHSDNRRSNVASRSRSRDPPTARRCRLTKASLAAGSRHHPRTREACERRRAASTHARLRGVAWPAGGKSSAGAAPRAPPGRPRREPPPSRKRRGCAAGRQLRGGASEGAEDSLDEDDADGSVFRLLARRRRGGGGRTRRPGRGARARERARGSRRSRTVASPSGRAAQDGQRFGGGMPAMWQATRVAARTVEDFATDLLYESTVTDDDEGSESVGGEKKTAESTAALEIFTGGRWRTSWRVFQGRFIARDSSDDEGRRGSRGGKRERMDRRTTLA